MIFRCMVGDSFHNTVQNFPTSKGILIPVLNGTIVEVFLFCVGAGEHIELNLTLELAD